MVLNGSQIDEQAQRDRWTVRRHGLWQRTADAEVAWASVAAHAGDDAIVQVRYVTGRSGPVLTGAEVRALVEGKK